MTHTYAKSGSYTITQYARLAGHGRRGLVHLVLDSARVRERGLLVGAADPECFRTRRPARTGRLDTSRPASPSPGFGTLSV